MPNAYYPQTSAPTIDLGGQEQFDPAVGETPEMEAMDREIPVRFIPASQLIAPAGTSPDLKPAGNLSLGQGRPGPGGPNARAKGSFGPNQQKGSAPGGKMDQTSRAGTVRRNK